MAALFSNETLSPDAHPVAALRARAVADARRLRALAVIALRDGAPHAALRARNARSAARRVLAHARALSALAPGPTLLDCEAGEPA